MRRRRLHSPSRPLLRRRHRPRLPRQPPLIRRQSRTGRRPRHRLNPGFGAHRLCRSRHKRPGRRPRHRRSKPRGRRRRRHLPLGGRHRRSRRAGRRCLRLSPHLPILILVPVGVARRCLNPNRRAGAMWRRRNLSRYAGLIRRRSRHPSPSRCDGCRSRRRRRMKPAAGPPPRRCLRHGQWKTAGRHRRQMSRSRSAGRPRRRSRSRTGVGNPPSMRILTRCAGRRSLTI